MQLDPDRSQLRSFLEAQFAYEKSITTARSLLAHLLAIVGVVIWVEAIWAGLAFPEEPRVSYFYTLGQPTFP